MKVEHNIYFDSNGKLNDKGKNLYVEAILLKRQTDLPAKIQDFVAENPSYQAEILDIYQMMKNEDPKSLDLNPYWKKQSKLPTIRKIVAGRSMKVAAVIAFLMLFSIAYLSWQNEFRIPSNISQSSNQITNQYIQSPFENIDTPFEKWEIESNKARTIYLENGTEINIPAHAFVDENGEKVNGKIDLYYREFHTAAQIMASGIPMTYDSAGVQHHFESGGMFEIRGKQNGKNVEIAMDKPLEVRMRSYVEDDDRNFNHYYLQEPKTRKELVLNSPLMRSAYAQSDSKKQDQPQWQYLGESKVVKGKQRIVKSEEEASDLLEEVEITETDEQVPDLCKIRFDTKNYPELEEYAQTTWQFVDKIGNADKYNPNSYENSNKMRTTTWEYASLTQPEYISFRLANGKAVRDACFSKDGKYILTASDSRIARLWAFDEEKISLSVKTELIGHHRNINLVKFSPNEKNILTTSTDKYAILWDKKGNIIQKFKGHEDAVTEACFSPNGKYILTASDDKTAKLWKTDGTLLHTFADFKEKVSKVAFSPNGKKILVSSYDWTAKLYNLKGKKLANLEGHKSWVNTAKFSPNGKYILTASPDQTVKVWNKHGKLLKTFPKQVGAINSAVFSDNSQEVLISAGNLWNKHGKSAVNLFDLKGNLKQSFPTKSMALNAQFSNEQDKIVIALSNGNPEVYHKTGQKVGTLDGKDWEHDSPIQKAIFSPSNKFILTFAEGDRFAKVWVKTNLEADEYVMQLKDKGLNFAKIYNKASQKFADTKKKYHNGEISKEDFRRAEREYQPILDKYRKGVTYFMGFVKRYNPSKDDKNFSGKVLDYDKIAEEVSENTNSVENIMLRNFTVRQFGTYNCDRSTLFTEWIGIDAKFKMSHDLWVNAGNIYQITGRSSTSIITYSVNQMKNFVFDATFTNNLLIILPENQVALVSQEDFENMDLKKIRDDKGNLNPGVTLRSNYVSFPKHTFKPKIYKLKNMEDLERVLARTQ